MTFTIEPMITMGSWRERIWPDGWTAVTADGLRTAQYEHTLVVTDEGAEVLTSSATASSSPTASSKPRRSRRRSTDSAIARGSAAASASSA
jgi:hypothetical protein